MTSYDSASQDHPLVSIVIPVRNEEAFIGANLNAIWAQDYPADRLEVLVADGMSEDRTRDIIKAMQVQHPNLHLVDNPNRIMPAGTNAAIRASSGDVVLLLGGHAELKPNYVSTCIRELLASGADCAGGSITSLGQGYIGEAIAVAMSTPFGVGSSGFRTSGDNAKPTWTDTVPFGCYRRTVFERIGLFNEEMVRHQDYEFHYRLRQAGMKILLIPSLRTSYFVRSSLPKLWKQYWQYGIWKGRFLKSHPSSLKWRHMVPPAFVAGIAAALLGALIFPLLWLLFGLAGGAYLAFLALAMVFMIRRGMTKYVPALLLVIPCLHFSWGAGVWLGLASSKVRWTPVPLAPRTG